MIIIKGIDWSEKMIPNESIRYNHCTAQTPFGAFLITWKGWKCLDSIIVDETPWDDCCFMPFVSLSEAKRWCEMEFSRRISECIG